MRGMRTGANILAALAFLALAARLLFICAAPPVIGYANNLDFFRQSSCVGVWQDIPGQARISAHLSGPAPLLVHDGLRISAFCMASSDNLFAWLLARTHRLGAPFSLREVGALKCLLTLVLTGLALLQPIGAAARLASALVALLVFGDIAVACSFNSLYVDASGIIAATLCLLGTLSLAARARPLRWTSIAGLALPLLWLGTVKPQYQLLACVFGVIDGLMLRRRSHDRVKACAIASVGVIAALLFSSLNAGPQSIMRTAGTVNRADVFLQAVLPEAADTPRALRILGLPPACAPAIGRNGYDEAVRTGRLCPELSGVSRLALLGLFAVSPATLSGPLTRGIDLSRPALLENLHPFAALPPGPHRGLVFVQASSLSAQIARLGRLEYRALFVVMVTFGAAALSVLVATAEMRPAGLPLGGLALLGLGGLDCLYGVASAVFGDGFVEAQRHEVLVLVGTASFLCGLAWCAGSAIERCALRRGHVVELAPGEGGDALGADRGELAGGDGSKLAVG